MNTMLYYGLMAILRNGNWVIISPHFDEVIRIKADRINDQNIFEELKRRGFFGPASPKFSGPEVSLVTLITTGACNLLCIYCFANSGASTIVMPEEVAFAAIRKGIKNASGKKLSIPFFGGEPTLTPDLIRKAVEYAKKAIIGTDVLGVEFSITTNGVMNRSFLEFLMENDFLITISMDGPPIVQDFQRPLKNGDESSSYAEETVRILTRSGKDFKIRATVTKYSVPYMVDTIEWLHSLGGKKIHFEVISIAGRAAMQTKEERPARPDVHVFTENLKRAITRGGELGVRVINSSFMNLMNPPKEFCDGNTNRRFAVSYTGEVTTCVEVQDKCHPVASQFITGCYDKSTGEIEMNREQRGRACGAKLQIGAINNCSECFAKRICGGGCPVRNFHTTRDSFTVDPYRCQLIKEIMPFIVGLFDKATYGD